MQLIRTLVIEDQPEQAAAITAAINTQAGFIVLGSGATVAEGQALIRATTPDLVLLDIQLRRGDAFQLLEELGTWNFKIIFLTGYEQFAIRAIKVGALDYLLKPVDLTELAAALAKFPTVATPTAGQVLAAGASYRKVSGQLALREGAVVHLIHPTDITHIAADGEHAEFFLENGERIRVAHRLKEYEDMLPPPLFLRPHQSFLVNTLHIRKYHTSGHLLLKNGKKVPVSEKRKDAVMKLILAT